MTEHAFKEAEENAWFNPFKKGGFIFKVPSNSGGSYVYGMTNDDGENGVDYFIWNAGLCGWQAYTQPTNEDQMRMTLYEAFFSAMLDVAKENGHTALDVFGVIPVIGEVADGINGIWYLVEGNETEAALSFVALVPILGASVAGSKLTLKFRKANGKIIGKVIDQKSIGKVICGNGRSGVCTIYTLKEVLSEGAILGLSKAQTGKLVQGLFQKDREELLKIFVANPKIVKAWKALEEAKLSDELWDIKKIEDIFDISKDYDKIGLDKLVEAVKSPEFFTDLNSQLKTIFTTNFRHVEAWTNLFKGGRSGLRVQPDAIEALGKLLDNPKIAASQINTKVLGKLLDGGGWAGNPVIPSYVDLVADIDRLISDLPINKVSNLGSYLGKPGFGNAGAFTRRHSMVQLNWLKNNINTIKQGNEIIFENPVNGIFGNSVSDIFIRIGNGNGVRLIEVETKAGAEFFDGLNPSNFMTQSFNSLSLVATRIQDYKVPLNPDILGKLANPVFFKSQKDKLVNAWVNANNGSFLNDPMILQKFSQYAGRNLNSDDLEIFLNTTDDWFRSIFMDKL